MRDSTQDEGPSPDAVAIPLGLDLMEQFGTTMRLPRDHVVHADGAAAEYCYRVLSGCVRTVRLMVDGRRQVGEFLLQDDLFGLNDLDFHTFSAETVTPVMMRRYPRRLIEALADSHPDLSRRLRMLTLGHLRAAQERLILLGRKTATERLASFVLEMEQRRSDQGRTRLDLPMCRTDIADHLGLTVETVCRVLAHLRREGVLGVSRAGLQVLDRAALHDLAGDPRS
jgi:CRP/FNR family nitrogen fixation transcriptional regulator